MVLLVMVLLVEDDEAMKGDQRAIQRHMHGEQQPHR